MERLIDKAESVLIQNIDTDSFDFLKSADIVMNESIYKALMEATANSI